MCVTCTSSACTEAFISSLSLRCLSTCVPQGKHGRLRPAGRAQELVAVIPPAAGAAPDTRGRSADARLFTSADLEALLPHVDLFSLNACAPA